MSTLLISFYTPATPYEKEVKGLIDSCNRWRIEYSIEPRRSLGSWEKNCAQKPFYILEKLKKHRRPVFWADADAAFVSAPDFSLFQDCDFSVRINASLPPEHPSKVMSGSIFINYTEEALSILQAWCQACESELEDPKRQGEFWDQTALRDALLSHKKARILPMPIAYVKIFDSDFFQIAPNQVILEHYQASRRFKKLIKM